MNAAGDGTIRGEAHLAMLSESQNALMGPEAHSDISGGPGRLVVGGEPGLPMKLY